MLASLSSREREFLLSPQHRLFQADLKVISQIGPTSRRGWIRVSFAEELAEDSTPVAEYLAEDLERIVEPAASSPSCPHSWIKRGVSVFVVRGAFLGLDKDLLGLAEVLELLLRHRV